MALDIFLSIPGIPGESGDNTFKGTIVTPSYAWSLANAATISSSGGGGSGKAVFMPLTIEKQVDSSSPLLMRALAQGRMIASMTLVLRATMGGSSHAAPFLVYQFQKVLVAALQESGSVDSDGAPTEAVTFTFGIYQLRYRTTNPDGSLSLKPITSAWNELTNSLPKGPAPR